MARRFASLCEPKAIESARRATEAKGTIYKARHCQMRDRRTKERANQRIIRFIVFPLQRGKRLIIAAESDPGTENVSKLYTVGAARPFAPTLTHTHISA